MLEIISTTRRILSFTENRDPLQEITVIPSIRLQNAQNVVFYSFITHKLLN